MPTKRRWLNSVIAAAAQPMPALPWERAARHPAPPAPPKAAPTPAVAAR